MSSYEFCFFALHTLITPAWLLLLLAPRSPVTARLVHSGLYPVVLGLVYGGLLVAGVFFGQAASGADMANLGTVMALFSHPNGTLTGWAHFLAFDLFVGAWIARDAHGAGISHMANLPALVLSLVFGPLGLLVHMVQRAATTDRGWSMTETG